MHDLGLLLIRAPAGLLLAAHGTQKLFGWFGGGGREATGEAFESMGYPRGRDMATLAGTTEVASGLGLAAGLCTPAAAAGTVGVLTNASVAAHGHRGLWNQQGGYEYPLVISAVAVGVAVHGPGALSADAAFGYGHTGPALGFGAVALGLAAAGGILATRRRRASENGGNGDSAGENPEEGASA